MAETVLMRGWSWINNIVPVRVPPIALWLGGLTMLMAYQEYVAVSAGSIGTFGFYDAAAVTFQTLHPARQTQLGIIVVGMVFWGVCRAISFSPFYRPKYFAFLEQSPWQFGKPLPLGPPYPSVRDAVVVGLLSLFAARGYLFGGALAIIVAVVAFSIPTLLMLYAIDLTGWFFVLAFSLTAYPWIASEPVGVIAWIILNVILLILSVHASLRAFPWHEEARRQWRFPDQWWTKDLVELFPTRYSKWTQSTRAAGWPLGALSPSTAGESFSRVTTLAWCALFGWCVAPLPPAYFFGGAIALFGYGSVRTAGLRRGCEPPIGLWGRIFTLRWIVPRFDIVILPCLAGVIGFMALSTTIAFLEVFELAPLRIAIFVIATGAAALVAFAPPQFTAWHLTGGYRGAPVKQRGLKQI